MVFLQTRFTYTVTLKFDVFEVSTSLSKLLIPIHAISKARLLDFDFEMQSHVQKPAITHLTL